MKETPANSDHTTTSDNPKQSTGNPCTVICPSTTRICDGNLAASLLLSQLMYWARRSDQEWFYQHMERLEEQLAIPVKTIYRARRFLVSLGVIEQKTKGFPRQVFIRVRFDRIAELKAALTGTQKTLFSDPPKIIENRPPFQDKTSISFGQSNQDKSAPVFGSSSPDNTKIPNRDSNTPTSQVQIDPPKEQPREKTALEERFLEFWKLYPKKIGKAEAFKAWKAHCQNGVFDDIKRTLAWQLESEQWTKEKGQFIPHPATYLRRHQWNDEPFQPLRKKPKFVV